VAWEHLQLQKLVQHIMNSYGHGAIVPQWPSTDFDSLFASASITWPASSPRSFSAIAKD